MLTFGSFPLFSAFRLGKLAGGGMRRLTATLPKLWSPCLAATVMNKIKIKNSHLTFQKTDTASHQVYSLVKIRHICCFQIKQECTRAALNTIVVNLRYYGCERNLFGYMSAHMCNANLIVYLFLYFLL